MKKTSSSKLPIAVLALIILAACGGGAGREKATAADRTIEIEMVDNAFRPSQLTVSKGETVNFRFRNAGSTVHDAFIGDAEEQKEHGEAMRSGGHERHGGEGITVPPGQTEELTHTFDEAGTIEIGCHQPGHYESGMKATITVALGSRPGSMS